MAKKRYAQVGLGGRSEMFYTAIVEEYTAHAELAAVCDRNPGRVRRCQVVLAEAGVEARGYDDAGFEQMIAECRPDVVIITTMDATHDHYICRAMELGCDVITEKPMTIDAERCRRILETQRRTGRQCRVTFNYRYSPPRTQIKDLLMSGIIGDIVSVDFQWMLDTSHGADYFRRWHRNKANSGGLMVHKSTHHFDLVNWWLSSIPVSVYAEGQRRFYTPQTAERYGLTHRGERCLTCTESGRCPFALDLREHPLLTSLYLDNEQYDGYFRDRCVFSPDIDIEDSMHLVVQYAGGARMTYSLHAFMPWEGYQVVFNGTKGRLEHKCQESVYINGDGRVPGELQSEGTWTRIYPHFASGCTVDLWMGEGGHGGGDPVMLDDLFLPNPPADPYLRAADQRAGACSILTGVAANLSMHTGRAVEIATLLPELAWPDYPPMPTATDPLSVPVSP
jgi:predicted dehydrogenase